MVLTTRRLRLVPFAASDAPGLRQMFNQRLVRRYLWDDRPVSEQTVAELIEASARSFVAARYGFWRIALRTLPDALIGFVGLRETRELGGIELLYGLEASHWGRGLATEAAGAVLRHAFDVAGLPEVVAGADPPNVASFRVMERLGMRPDGEVTVGGRPTRRYRLGRTELAPAPFDASRQPS
jgi:RimJ/RimL family protein N-acetyltransferase